MKHYYILFVIIVLLFTLFFSIKIDAVSFEQTLLDVNQDTEYLYNSIDVAENEDSLKHTQIWDFTVNSNGYIAVGFNDYCINIYDNNLNFKYRLKPSYSHCTYSLEWNNDILNIYVQSNTLSNCISFYDGNVKEVYFIEDTANNRRMWKRIDNNKTNEIVTDEYKYYIKDFKLFRSNKETTTNEIIVDIKHNGLILFIVILIWLIIFTFIILNNKIKKKKIKFSKYNNCSADNFRIWHN